MHDILSVDVYTFENIIMTDMMTVIVILLLYFQFNGQYMYQAIPVVIISSVGIKHALINSQ